IELGDGRVMVVVGDVTDKGVPAALVMAGTHALLRSAAPRLRAPGQVLARVNDLLCEDTPAHMFVTCLALVLDPDGGQIEFANAGHDLPYLRSAAGVTELRARGMPLGLMPGMEYEQMTAWLLPGDQLLLHSDGLAEAHNPGREMFGFPRVAELAGRDVSGPELIDACLAELASFTGPGYEQEDDITLLTLRRTGTWHPGSPPRDAIIAGERVLDEFAVPSKAGAERQAIAGVSAAVAGRYLSGPRLERLKTAVAETVMNAAEHGNRYRGDLTVDVRVTQSGDRIVVAVTDHGGAPAQPGPAVPDLGLKLAGEQSPRGWGLFLIRNMADAMDEVTDGPRHTVLLTMRADGAEERRERDGKPVRG
ncbi:MAG: ATP-binding SpoIIE family protein phosphatase, partial [Streptosporangiaceae bacterium]